jgi:hypothetical protein
VRPFDNLSKCRILLDPTDENYLPLTPEMIRQQEGTQTVSKKLSDTCDHDKKMKVRRCDIHIFVESKKKSKEIATKKPTPKRTFFQSIAGAFINSE